MMEREINKDSFLDEFRKARDIGNRKAKDRSPGFVYIHTATVKSLAEKGEFKVGDIDFSRFTAEDLAEYMEYYEHTLAPKVSLANKLFSTLRSANTVFAPSKSCY